MASSSQISSQYYDIAEGKPISLGTINDSIETLQITLCDVEKKVSLCIAMVFQTSRWRFLYPIIIEFEPSRNSTLFSCKYDTNYILLFGAQEWPPHHVAENKQYFPAVKRNASPIKKNLVAMCPLSPRRSVVRQ